MSTNNTTTKRSRMTFDEAWDIIATANHNLRTAQKAHAAAHEIAKRNNTPANEAELLFACIALENRRTDLRYAMERTARFHKRIFG